jgi:hypothetical protein
MFSYQDGCREQTSSFTDLVKLILNQDVRPKREYM